MFAEVQDIEVLSPSLLRLVLAGGTLDEFVASEATDAYINAQFLPEASPLTVPFGPDDLDDLPSELRPKPRRFTIRRWEPERQALTIDFVTHGDIGYAGSWAARATLGDRLQFSGPGGSYRPTPDVDWHLLAGDESALGAIGATLESLPSRAKTHVFVVVDGPDHEIELPTEADATIEWLHRNSSERPELLLSEAIAAADLPGGSFDVFVHGEATEVRETRRHLVAEHGIDPKTASISPYWRRRHTDEDWRKIKRQWMAEQAADV